LPSLVADNLFIAHARSVPTQINSEISSGSAVLNLGTII